MLFVLSALAAPSQLTWDLAVNGNPVGTQKVTVKILPSDTGTRRVIEGFTDVSGQVGPAVLRYRQRLTVHSQGAEPASFHSVVDQNGEGVEVQGRWTPSGWTVTTNVGGRTRTGDYGLDSIDLSTADLLDPLRRTSMADGSQLRLLSAMTGEVVGGGIQALGASEVRIAGQAVDVEGFSWSGSSGKQTWYFSSEGYLVKFRTMVSGVPVDGQLTAPPPGGVDDFPVRVGRPAVEKLAL